MHREPDMTIKPEKYRNYSMFVTVVNQSGKNDANASEIILFVQKEMCYWIKYQKYFQNY